MLPCLLSFVDLIIMIIIIIIMVIVIIESKNAGMILR